MYSESYFLLLVNNIMIANTNTSFLKLFYFSLEYFKI